MTPESLEHYLGKPKYRQEKVNEKPAVGIVRGLAWTSVGGDTLEIEVNMMPGEGKIDLTGQMGDVMKESARTALSYVRSVSGQYKIADNFIKRKISIFIFRRAPCRRTVRPQASPWRRPCFLL